MENKMLKYFLSFSTSIIIFVILVLVKRNSNNTYWVKFWFMSPLIPMFLFFLFGTILGDKAEINVIIFTFIFLLLIILSLSENNKIQDNKIINSKIGEKKIINIDEIQTITFTHTSYSSDSTGLTLNIQTSFNTYIINSVIEDIDGFIFKIKERNNKIIVIGNKWHGAIFLILWNLITFIMLVYTFYCFFEEIMALLGIYWKG
jgi:hypothetical protein